MTWAWDLILPGCRGTSSHNIPVTRRWDRCFYTVRGGVDPGVRFRPRLVVLIVVELWKDSRTVDGNLFSPPAVEPRRLYGWNNLYQH